MTAPSIPPGRWQIATDRSQVSLTVKKLGVLTVRPTMDISDGGVVVDDSGQVSLAEVRLAAASFSTGNDKRDTHVRSSDFLDADDHPEISFRATDIGDGTGDRTVAGTLTVKGVEHPVAVDVSGIRLDGRAASFTVRSIVDRNTLGVDGSPNFVVAPKIAIEATLTADLEVSA